MNIKNRVVLPHLDSFLMKRKLLYSFSLTGEGWDEVDNMKLKK